mgnify:CR=1 FL=1
MLDTLCHRTNQWARDLGEFVGVVDEADVTAAGHPRSFEREGLGDYNDDPQTITRRARERFEQSHYESAAEAEEKAPSTD